MSVKTWNDLHLKCQLGVGTWAWGDKQVWGYGKDYADSDVRKAFDGPSAVSAAVSYRPDVVLLDVGLPGMSGLEVARELRRRPETSSARLIALTGWGQAGDRHATRDAGFDAHLTKPTDPDVLEAVLNCERRNCAGCVDSCAAAAGAGGCT